MSFRCNPFLVAPVTPEVCAGGGLLHSFLQATNSVHSLVIILSRDVLACDALHQEFEEEFDLGQAWI